MDSTASENSLASTPEVLIASAMTPASGPGPTATRKIIPSTRSGADRTMSRNRRTGICMKLGVMLREASRPSGTAISTAMDVPQMAICTVSHIWAT